MPAKEPLFKDLITMLKDIHSPEDAPPNLFDELLNATLAVGLGKLLEDGTLTEFQGLEILEKEIVRHLGAIKYKDQ